MGGSGHQRCECRAASRNKAMMIMAPQCRSARTLLSWSVCRPASAASVRQRDIDDFEPERRLPTVATAGAIRRALEAARVVFLPDDGVRVRAVPSEMRRIRSRTGCRAFCVVPPRTVYLGPTPRTKSESWRRRGGLNQSREVTYDDAYGARSRSGTPRRRVVARLRANALNRCAIGR